LKNLGYNFLKYWIKAGLHCYYGKIIISGKENIPKNQAVIFLPNHQNALLDVLLIGVDCNRKPWFLTRSDVFKNSILKWFFSYLQMIPIYRIRDGRESLKNNEAVFNNCASLLEKKEAILMFPEANHNLKRRVRPLSKGFTRIILKVLEQSPEVEIFLVPVGLNYKKVQAFPDQMAIHFGKPISVQTYYQKSDLKTSVLALKHAVASSLKTLTTHIEDEDNYAAIIAGLNAMKVNYLKPSEVNQKIDEATKQGVVAQPKRKFKSSTFFLTPLFTLLNLPVVLGWRLWLKPKVWEPEFTDTLRFGYALIAGSLYYLLVFAILAYTYTPFTAGVVVLGIFIGNWLYVKLVRS